MNSHPRLRQVNAVVSALLLLTFTLHGVTNGLYLAGVLPAPMKGIAHITELICWIHILIGVYLTVDTARALGKSKASYTGENLRFWAIRISGIMIAVLMLQHVIGSSHAPSHWVMPIPAIVNGVLLALAVGVHVVCNMRSQLMSLGLPTESSKRAALVAAILILLMGFAFVLVFVQGRVV